MLLAASFTSLSESATFRFRVRRGSCEGFSGVWELSRFRSRALAFGVEEPRGFFDLKGIEGDVSEELISRRRETERREDRERKESAGFEGIEKWYGGFGSYIYIYILGVSWREKDRGVSCHVSSRQKDPLLPAKLSWRLFGK